MKRAVALMIVSLSIAAGACDGSPVEEAGAPQLTLATHNVSVDPGDTVTVVAHVLHSSEAAQFVSRDPNVATVNAIGRITAGSPGTTRIVATLAGGAGASDSVIVQVVENLPITGVAVPGMEAYDKMVPNLLRKYKFPGGAIAVVKDGRLVYARGFGYADLEHKAPVQPDALFRIASVSKSFTAVAIMKLVEEGKLKLEDRVAPIIADLTPAPGAIVDPRWEQITIRNLLNHTGGWDREKPNGGYDPMGLTLIAAAAMNAPSPASPETLIRYMKGKPLDFNPGERWAYSNFGYLILGRVIERVSGMKYEDYVRSRVLQPVGANRTREGKTRLSQAAVDEVRYYEPGQGLNPVATSIFAGEGLVPVTYGGFDLEIGDSSGAWISSTIDLLRFLRGIDGRGHGPSLLPSALVGEITGHGVPSCNNTCFYGGGFWYRPVGSDATWWHGGDLIGATALIVRTYHNYSWAGLFNSNSGSAIFDKAFDDAMWSTLEQVDFPAHDLFSTFR